MVDECVDVECGNMLGVGVCTEGGGGAPLFEVFAVEGDDDIDTDSKDSSDTVGLVLR